MKRFIRMSNAGLVMLLSTAVAFWSGSALAEKPAWAGGGNGESHGKPGKGDKQERGERGGDRGGREARDSRGGDRGGVTLRFDERRRTVIREYYTREFGAGRCPPGLAKKGNGCMPPGQAKKWSVGRPLPRDVVYYDLPRGLVVEIGLPPEGYKYVRIASDILMIAVGTSMVVDAIEDLSGM